MQTSNNTILITGGTSGIGLELAKQLLALKNQVIVTGRDAQKLKMAQTQLPGLKTIQSDVSQVSAIESLAQTAVREFPKLNILINNAGIMRTLNLHQFGADLTDLTREIETNLMGPIRLTQALLPHLKNQSAAAVMNVSSGLAFVPLPSSPIYCATKAGLHSFTQSLRVQLKKSSVKVFELAPPATETELLSEMTTEDRKGISIMKVQDMVAAAVRGLQNDTFEIRPGQSNQLKLMSRLAPEFILRQLSGPVDRMLGKH